MLASAPVRCWYWVVNALLHDCAKSVMNGVPAGSDSPWSLLKVMPCTVNVFGQATGDCGFKTPALNSAVDVMIFIVDPGATSAVSAKSLKPSLLAIARILPVDGWMTTIELSGCILTAACAAASAVGLIVVSTDCTFSGPRMLAWLFLTGVSVRGLDLDVEARLAVPGRRRLHQQVRDVREPGVTVGLQVTVVGVADHLDARRDLDGGQVRLGGEVRPHHGGLPRHEPDA